MISWKEKNLLKKINRKINRKKEKEKSFFKKRIINITTYVDKNDAFIET